MYLKNLLAARLRSGDVDIALLPNTNLVSEAEDNVAASVGVEGEIVEATVGEAVAVICNIARSLVILSSFRGMCLGMIRTHISHSSL